ncbi:hypothetical protein [Shinella zoogloeoides]|uniref:hypothetical protein n=1 Tax=Shinella zoogloeoides TaxID=352475 RepID=UPI0028AC6651|nr:hypothetical protein [Shinella zoogloeoides]
MADEPFVICDLRKEWSWRPYVTFWRPKNSNYAYPLSWAGDYTKAEVDAQAAYYTEKEGRSLVRFAIPRSVAERLSEAPAPGIIDGDAGPVVVQTPENLRKLRAAAYIPATDAKGAANE